MPPLIETSTKLMAVEFSQTEMLSKLYSDLVYKELKIKCSKNVEQKNHSRIIRNEILFCH